MRDRFKPTEPSSENVVEVRVGFSSTKDVVEITVNGSLCWFGYVYATQDDPAAALIPGRNLFREVGTDRAISFAMELLRDCNEHHSDCQPPPDPSPLLPTRVIDCTDPSRPHLVTTDARRDRYVALSYVWGEGQPHKTTKANIVSYHSFIDPATLPSTILDAINVTHRLGLPYLWIDSLCIIQDSDEDKDHELTRMRNVYTDAYVTIIAASATRVSEGFLQPRTDTLGPAAVALPFLLPDALGEIHLSSWLITTPKYEPSSEPLHTRGWCMQEYFLSPRELIFASHTLQYRCRISTRNIAGANNPWWISSARDPPPFSGLPRPPKTRKEIEDVRGAWKAVVENYIKRGLSRSDDKLVALASLAEEFHDVVQAPYLAGLWRSTILPDMLWSKDRAHHFTPRPKSYRAPSWSWAALDGPINPGNAYFLSDDEHVIAEVVKCETVLKKPNLPFGEVVAGSLVIRARVVIDCTMMVHWTVFRLRSLDEHGPQDEMIDEETGKRMQDIGQCQLDSGDEDITTAATKTSRLVFVGCLLCLYIRVWTR
ncbi:hypothetical protein HGRIS_010501 [Hohenbuehelia grisea]|uniref:Heterokaryon incompatibility domain-containing protein n=1 Tax=Hohenbuehelia grisea TaxID=104357 RepID=A0ABR3IX06_9AGAR